MSKSKTTVNLEKALKSLRDNGIDNDTIEMHREKIIEKLNQFKLQFPKKEIMVFTKEQLMESNKLHNSIYAGYFLTEKTNPLCVGISGEARERILHHAQPSNKSDFKLGIEESNGAFLVFIATKVVTKNNDQSYKVWRNTEKQLIKVLGCKCPHGYNSTDGGDGHPIMKKIEKTVNKNTNKPKLTKNTENVEKKLQEKLHSDKLKAKEQLMHRYANDSIDETTFSRMIIQIDGI